MTDMYIKTDSAGGKKGDGVERKISSYVICFAISSRPWKQVKASCPSYFLLLSSHGLSSALMLLKKIKLMSLTVMQEPALLRDSSEMLTAT